MSRSRKKKVGIKENKDALPRLPGPIYRSIYLVVLMVNIMKLRKKGMILCVIKSGRHLIIKINLINHNRKGQQTQSRNSKSCFLNLINPNIP